MAGVDFWECERVCCYVGMCPSRRGSSCACSAFLSQPLCHHRAARRVAAPAFHRLCWHACRAACAIPSRGRLAGVGWRASRFGSEHCDVFKLSEHTYASRNVRMFLNTASPFPLPLLCQRTATHRNARPSLWKLVLLRVSVVVLGLRKRMM